MLHALAIIALCIFIGTTILWIIACFQIASDKRRQKSLLKQPSDQQPIPWSKAILLGCFLAALLEGALAFH